jgi:DNA-directed RNA polymerase alpha subunit
MTKAGGVSFENIHYEDKFTLKFQVKNTNVSYANTLRRLCMSHVPVVGFRADMTDQGTTTDVIVKTNSTPMTNEMLAHRIGLIPLAVKDPLAFKPENYKFILNIKKHIVLFV